MKVGAALLALCLSSCATIRAHQQPIEVCPPEGAAKAIKIINRAYAHFYPRLNLVDVRVRWYASHLLPVAGERWARGYSSKTASTCEISVIVTESISDGPLAHEMLHCFQEAITPDDEWSDTDKDLVWWANEMLKSQGL